MDEDSKPTVESGPLNTHPCADLLRAAVASLNQAVTEAESEGLTIEVTRSKKSGFFSASIYRVTYLFPTEDEDGQLSLTEVTEPQPAAEEEPKREAQGG
jgi:hypothetical protein